MSFKTSNCNVSFQDTDCGPNPFKQNDAATIPLEENVGKLYFHFKNSIRKQNLVYCIWQNDLEKNLNQNNQETKQSYQIKEE